MSLGDMLYWLTSMPAEDAASVMYWGIVGLAYGLEPELFELEARGISVDDAMDACSGVGLEEGILEMAEEYEWDCTDEDIERWARQLVVQVAVRLAQLVEQAREGGSAGE